MKKFLAVVIALMLMMNCMAALADSVYTKVNVNNEVLNGVLTGFGVPEDQLAVIDPVLSLVNALGVNVITAADGAQIDLDLNGTGAISIAFAPDDQNNLALASSLIPSYTITVSEETLTQMMESVSSNMPAATGSIMDMAGISETLSGYFVQYMQTCSSAGQVGEAVPGEYEYEGYKFDVMIPVTIDMQVVRDATKTLFDQLASDETVMSAIKASVQQQNPEATFDEAELQSFCDEWVAHIPDSAYAEYYGFSSGDETFYMVGQASYDGKDEPTYGFDMLYAGQNNMAINFASFDEMSMECVFVMADNTMYASFKIPEMFVGFGMEIADTAMHFDVYFMNEDSPLLCVDITASDAGALTLNPNDGSRTVVSVEQLMGGDEDAANGLLTDVMTTAGTLMNTVMEAVPEAAALIGMISGGVQ